MVGLGTFTDVPRLPMWNLVSQGLRDWDSESGGLLERLTEKPNELYQRHSQKIWRLPYLLRPESIPDSLIDYLLVLVGFGPGAGAGYNVLKYLTVPQKRVLAKVAAKFWRSRGRIDGLSDAIRYFASGVRPRFLTWFWSGARVGSATVGGYGTPGTDLNMLKTEHFYDLDEDDAHLTMIRVPDYGDLNRDIVEALAELARPLPERYEISYVHFVDTFADGRLGHWENKLSQATWVDGEEAPLASPTVPKLQGLRFTGHAREAIVTPTSTDWTDYIVSFVPRVDAGSFAVRFHVVDEDNYYSAAFLFNSARMVLVRLLKTVSGSTATVASTPIASGYELPLQTNVRVQCEVSGSNTYAQVYVGDELLCSGDMGSNHPAGGVEFQGFSSSADVRISMVEVTPIPLDTTVLGPG